MFPQWRRHSPNRQVPPRRTALGTEIMEMRPHWRDVWDYMKCGRPWLEAARDFDVATMTIRP